jgi:pantoate--beta-alanine ligase
VPLKTKLSRLQNTAFKLGHPVNIISSIDELRAWRKTIGTLAFVPTMGNLHEGHLRLIEEAKKLAPDVLVSIFVNRLQFGQGEDFDQYPRTLTQDAEKLAQVGVETIFAPTEQTLYPNVIQQYKVDPPALQDELCGAFRPGHFRGVATVVAKLFNLVQPNYACFGKKDFQQLFIIHSMVKDLNFPIEIQSVDTGRAPDGLALSSRNAYLSPTERAEAPRLYQHLNQMRTAILAGENDYGKLQQTVHSNLTQRGWQVDYVEIRCKNTLKPASASDKTLVILIAARQGKTRLIDNIELNIV